MFKIHTKYGDKMVEVATKIQKYAANGNTSIYLWCVEEGHKAPWSSLTVNLDEKLPEDMCFIDTNNNGNNILSDLIEAGIIDSDSVVGYGTSGFCMYPLVKVNLDVIKNHEEEWLEI